MQTKELHQTWRWFGPADPVTLQDVKQTGARGIVTALHHVPHGEVWSLDAIQERKKLIEASGLTWDVVESLTVHEDIKTGARASEEWIAKYRESLRNLAAAGLKIVTYNFMPVTDWTRTSFGHEMPDGSRALSFNWVELAAFDIHILKRRDAAATYPRHITAEAHRKFSEAPAEEIRRLEETVLAGIPGEGRTTLEAARASVERYRDVTAAALRGNLVGFLRNITPLCDELGIRLALHPDDPPFSILGLPRVVSTLDDVRHILRANPSSSNGVCFCTGSFGANPANDPPAMIRELGSRIHFAHLRNTRRDALGNFFEDDHLAGDTDMYSVMRELLILQQRLPAPIPFRPDHGHQMIDDLRKVTHPGYSCIGRLRGLAELRGLQLGILRGPVLHQKGTVGEPAKRRGRRSPLRLAARAAQPRLLPLIPVAGGGSGSA